MKILYLEWNSYANRYVKEAFISSGNELIIFDFPASDNPKNNEAVTHEIVLATIKHQVDFVFSLNYYPTVAIACKACKIKYVSWTYDSPYVLLYSDTILFPTNYLFVFEQAEYFNLKNLGAPNVFYLPMAAPVEYYDSLDISDEDHRKYDSDITMIGSMYSEAKHSLYSKLEELSDYDKGYLESLIESQKFLYGTNIITQALSDDLVGSISKLAPMLFPDDELQTPAWTYSYYFLLREVTKRERKEALSTLSNCLNVTLFTHEETPFLEKVNNKGSLEYYLEMPKAMKCSKINLNITLRSIVSGMPLRAFDIMGCNGFLLTNYQSDFLSYFAPDNDYVYFEDKHDLVVKSDYYLKHSDERRAISQNGYNKVKEAHTYNHRIAEMLSIISE